jgi:putative CocE/NonD family hydrolase
MDQTKIIERPDVLTFTTGELAAPTEITGRVKMKLFISSDAPDTDFFVKLCDVYPDGRSFNICEGQLRARFRYGFLDEVMLKPGEINPLDIDLSSTSIIVNKGHKLQVLITSSNSPAFEVNPNTGEPFRASGRMQVAHNSIYMDTAHPSAIILPVAKR